MLPLEFRNSGNAFSLPKGTRTQTFIKEGILPCQPYTNFKIINFNHVIEKASKNFEKKKKKKKKPGSQILPCASIGRLLRTFVVMTKRGQENESVNLTY